MTTTDPEMRITNGTGGDLSRYEQYVHVLTGDPIILEMAMSMPHGYPIHHLVTPGVDGDTKFTFLTTTNLTYELGLLNSDRTDAPLHRPEGAVPDALYRVCRQIGLALQ